MFRKLAVPVLLLVVLRLAGCAEEPKPEADPALAEKPQYERYLQGDDVQRGAELNARISKAEEANQFDEALRLIEELLTLRLRLQGPDHWETVNERSAVDTRRKLAALSVETRAGWENALQRRYDAFQLIAKGELAKAQPLLHECCRSCLQVFGEKHPYTAESYYNLAMNLNAQGKYVDAQPLFQKALDLRREVFGEKHPDTAKSYFILALNLDIQQKYAEAQPLSQKALDLRREVLGEKHSDTADCYCGLANNLYRQGKYLDAQPLFQKALDLRRGLLGEEHRHTADSYYDLANNLYHQGKHLDAQPLYQKALDLYRELLGEKHRDTADIYNNLANNLNAQEKYADAQPLYEKALDLKRELLGEKDPETAGSYRNLANNLKVQGKYADAQPLFQRALDLRRELLGEKHLDTAESYNNLACNLGDQGKYLDAQPLFQRALDLRRELVGERHLDTAGSYNNLALNLEDQGNYADAQPLLQNALDLQRELVGEKHLDTAAVYNNLAVNLKEQGRYADAQPLYEKALDLRLKLVGEKHLQSADSYNNLATNLSAQGKYADAQPLFQKALDLRREFLGEKHIDMAASYNNLALNLGEQGKYLDAQPLFQKALELCHKILGENHPYTAKTYNNLANNLTAQVKYADAQPLLQKALDLQRELLGETHPDTAASYNNLGVNLSAQGKYADAQPLFQKALELSRKILGEKHPETATRYRGLAAMLYAQGKYVDALPLLIRAAEAYEAARLSISGWAPDRAIFGEQRSPYPLLAVTEARLLSAATAWIAAETDLARGLSDELARSRGTALTADEQTRQAALNTRLNALQPQILQFVSKQELTDPEREELVRLQAERTALDAGLAELAVALSQREIALLSQVQGALAADAVLVFWVDVRLTLEVSEHWGCIVRHTGEPAWERLPGTGADGTWTLGDLSLAQNLREALTSGTDAMTDFDVLASKLHAQRLAPLSQHLEGVKSLYVVPVNEMAGIPIEVLTRDFTVSYIPSGTFLTRLADRPPANDIGLLALGDPVFSRPAAEPKPATGAAPDPILFSLRGGHWNDLPGTRAEVTQIAKLFGPESKTLVDSAASEQALEELRKHGDLSQFGYLHFATHGAANDVRSFESALILAQDTLPPDPLPRAGEPFINGQLSASEVLEFWNLNADLVTLSACETALGRRGGGDGLLGFAQAFLKAGSRSVCLSLWKVDDAATALLMTRFYENLLGKRPGLKGPMPKALALAEAKRWLRDLSAEEALQLAATATNDVVRGDRGKGEDLKLVIPAADPKQPAGKKSKPFAHPRFWSAFILIGDPN